MTKPVKHDIVSFVNYFWKNKQSMKFLYCLIFILLPYLSIAQTEKYNIPFTGNYEGKFYGFSDGHGDIATGFLSYVNGALKTYKTHLVFNSQQGVKDIALPGKLNIAGYSYDENSYTFYYQNEYAVDNKIAEINSMQIRKDGLEMLGAGVISYNDESVIGNFQHDGIFYLLTASAKTSKLKVRKISGTDNVEEIVFGLNKGTATRLSKMKFVFVEDNLEMNLKQTLFKNKFFFRDGNIYMLTSEKLNDNKAGDVKIVSLNFATKTSSIKKITPNMGSYNYYPLNEKLLLFHIDKNAIRLQIRNLTDQSVINDLSIKENEIAKFLNSGVYKNGALMDKYADRQMGEELLKRLNSGEEFISAIQRDGRIQLMLGSYYLPPQTQSVSGPIGNPIVVGSGYSINTFQSTSPTNIVDFAMDDVDIYYAYAYLNAEDLSIDSHEYEDSSDYHMLNQYVESLEADKKKKVKDYTIYNAEDGLYLISYSKKSKQFTIRKWGHQ